MYSQKSADPDPSSRATSEAREAHLVAASDADSAEVPNSEM